MDPITLFALANGAVAAVKQGCKLYKDIKGAAGEVKDVLKDLDQQFHKMYEGKPVPLEAKKQLQEEKARIVELNKKDPGDIYDQIGEQLSIYYENYAKCRAIFQEEENRSKEVYTGDASIGKRALQRVLMHKKLEQMGVELRELMVYQSPPELGALYTEVSEMMEKIGEEQATAIAKKMQEDRARAIRRAKRIENWRTQAAFGVAGVVVAGMIGIMFALVVEDRIRKYPHLGDGWIPTTPEQRAEAAKPKIYVGR
jgi:ribosomal protein S18